MWDMTFFFLECASERHARTRARARTRTRTCTRTRARARTRTRTRARTHTRTRTRTRTHAQHTHTHFFGWVVVRGWSSYMWHYSSLYEPWHLDYVCVCVTHTHMCVCLSFAHSSQKLTCHVDLWRACTHQHIHNTDKRHTRTPHIKWACTAYLSWGDIFECCFKAQSSKLERLFCHVSVKRDVRVLSFELWKSFSKMSPKVGLAVHVILIGVMRVQTTQTRCLCCTVAHTSCVSDTCTWQHTHNTGKRHTRAPHIYSTTYRVAKTYIMP